MSIKCPNCNHDIFDDYKCPYCQYVINPKRNNFEKEIYEYLKADYVNTRNKAITIKNGMSKYNKTMKEIKEIVDYIADEIYDLENYKSKEEVSAESIVVAKYNNNKVSTKIKLLFVVLTLLSTIGLIISATKYSNKTITVILAIAFVVSLSMLLYSFRYKGIKVENAFYYSFIQYFIHDLIYKILLLGILGYLPVYFQETFFQDSNILLIVAWYLAVYFVLVYFLFKWGETIYSSIAINYDKITFSFQKRNPYLSGTAIKRSDGLNWANYVDYDIYSITNVVETFNSFIIYGDITKRQFCMTTGGIAKHFPSKKYKKIVIRKCFNNNKELIRILKNKIK